MSFNIEWTNADALTPKQFTVYESVPVTYSTTTAPFGDLQRENAKLRELVRDMWEDVCNAPCCAYCDHSDYDGDKCELRDRMRELGVEV